MSKMRVTQIAKATPFYTGARTGTWAVVIEVLSPSLSLSWCSKHTICKVEMLHRKYWNQNKPSCNHLQSWHLPCAWKIWGMPKSHQEKLKDASPIEQESIQHVSLTPAWCSRAVIIIPQPLWTVRRMQYSVTSNKKHYYSDYFRPHQ